MRACVCNKWEGGEGALRLKLPPSFYFSFPSSEKTEIRVK